MKNADGKRADKQADGERCVVLSDGRVGRGDGVAAWAGARETGGVWAKPCLYTSVDGHPKQS